MDGAWWSWVEVGARFSITQLKSDLHYTNIIVITLEEHVKVVN